MGVKSSSGWVFSVGLINGSSMFVSTEKNVQSIGSSVGLCIGLSYIDFVDCACAQATLYMSSYDIKEATRLDCERTAQPRYYSHWPLATCTYLVARIA